jgi:putative DNA primase/helicase
MSEVVDIWEGLDPPQKPPAEVVNLRKPGIFTKLADAGFGGHILPALSKEKRPAFLADDGKTVIGLTDWPTLKMQSETLPRYDTAFGNGLCGLCIRTGVVIGIDIDVVDPGLADAIGAAALRLLGWAPTRVGRAPKRLLAYRCDSLYRKVTLKLFRGEKKKPDHLVEVLAKGQHFAAYGEHQDGKPYTWNHELYDVGFGGLTPITKEQIRAFITEAQRIAAAAGFLVTGAAKDKSGAAKDKPDQADHGPSRDTFFTRVNSAALSHLADWIPAVFPTARMETGTKAWRVKSDDLGRGLEEDISFHPEGGGRDFGHEKPITPIDAVIGYGNAATPKDAAFWLCDELKIDPATLGWQGTGASDDAGSAAKKPAKLVVGSDVELAERVLGDLHAQHGTVVHAEGAFARYDGKRWVSISPEALRRIVYQYDGRKYGTQGTVRLSKGRIDSLLHEAASMAAQPSFFVDAPAGINCASGFIRFDRQGTPSLEPHDPDHRVRHVLPGRWNPGADWRRDGSLLSKLFDGCFKDDADKAEKIALSAELFGCAALGYGTKLRDPKAIVMHGPKAQNGKAQFLDAMRGLLPAEAVAAVSPAQFGEDAFLVQLVGRLLNAREELSVDAIVSNKFKEVVTGDLLMARDVYSRAVMFRAKALNVFAANNLPTFKGGFDRGVQRRLLLIPFNRMIPEEERLPGLGARIAAEEPELLLAFAVEGAARLVSRGFFSEPQSCKRALRDWIHTADPVLAWHAERTEYAEGARWLQREAYSDFRTWAVAEGFGAQHLPAINNFSARLYAQDGRIKSVRSDANEPRQFVNLRRAGPVDTLPASPAELFSQV